MAEEKAEEETVEAGWEAVASVVEVRAVAKAVAVRAVEARAAAARVVVAMVVVATAVVVRVAVERERSTENRSSSPRCAVYGRAREARALRIRQQRPGS